MSAVIIDAELLIAAVEQRPALWMASHRQHKDKYVKAALWREVAAAVMPGGGIEEGVELAQKRWKSLRDKFRRIFFAHKNRQRSGAGQDDAESGDSTWPFFDLLLFLKDTMQTRVTSGNYASGEASPASQLVSPASQTPRPASQMLRPASHLQRPASQAVRPASQPVGPPSPAVSSKQTAQELLGNIMQFEDIESDLLLDSSIDATFEAPSRAPSPFHQVPTLAVASAVLATPIRNAIPPQRRGAKRKHNDTDTHFADLCEALKKTEPRNEHEHFGLCVAKYMQNVPEQRQLELKIRVLKLVEEYTSQ